MSEDAHLPHRAPLRRSLGMYERKRGAAINPPKAVNGLQLKKGRTTPPVLHPHHRLSVLGVNQNHIVQGISISSTSSFLSSGKINTETSTGLLLGALPAPSPTVNTSSQLLNAATGKPGAPNLDNSLVTRRDVSGHLFPLLQRAICSQSHKQGT